MNTAPRKYEIITQAGEPGPGDIDGGTVLITREGVRD